MKRKVFTIITLFLLCATVMVGVACLSACTQKHTHNFTAATTAPTCTQQGYTTYTCECGYSYVDDYVAPAGHFGNYTYTTNKVEATCEHGGSYDEVVYCKDCYKELSRTHRTTEKLSHTPLAAVIENEVSATCEHGGSYDEVVYCKYCYKELSRTHRTTETTTHMPLAAVKENEVEATCEHGGSYDEVVYCKYCRTELSRTHRTTEKASHSYSNGICGVCGTKIEDETFFTSKNYAIDADERNITRTVSNNIVSVDLKTEFELSSGCRWELCRDFSGNEKISLKVLSLETGHNYAYIFVFYEQDPNYFTRYLLDIYRIETFSYAFSDGSIISQGTVEKGETVNSIDAPEKSGYVFLGWKVNGAIVSFPYKITEDTVFTAYYEILEYTIKYELNGGTTVNENPSTYTAWSGDITLNNPVREDYTFMGWYTDEDFTNQITTIQGGMKQNLVLHALWRYGTEGLSYILSDDGTYYSVSGYSGTSARVAIPDNFNNLPVKEIATFAFYNNFLIRKVIIGKNVTEINNSAFEGCSYLSSITIPDNVTYIGNLSFCNCESLTTAIIGSGVTYIGNSAFYRTGLKSITIGNGVTDIGMGAFYGCGNLTNMTLPFVGANVGGVGKTYFGYIFGAVSYSENTTYVPPSLRSVTITGTSSVNDYAFYGCDGLTDVVISGSITIIGEWAFSGCSSLTSIIIPDSVTNIGSSAFSGCSSLESLTLPFVGAKAGVTSSDTYQYPFGYIFGTSSYSGGTAVEQYYYGSSTSSTTSATFYIPSSLKSVTVTGGNLLYGAFRNCSSLTSVTVPDIVTSIGNTAFSGCSSLTSITIPDSVTSIGNYAFNGCSGFTSISIPDSVTSIGNYAFAYCKGLTSITIPDSVTSIGDYAFYGCSGLTSVTIPNSVTSIGNYAFACCEGLTSVTIPDSVTSIGDWVFWNCSKLTSVIIGNSVPSIGDYAFRNCGSLTSVTIGNSVTSIGSSAFLNCISLTSIMVAEGNKVYHSDGNCLIETENKTLILGCKNSVIPTDGSVTSIGGSAFYGCSGLTSVTIPNSVTSIGGSAFYGCSGLTSVTIPNSVTSIGPSAFRDCSGLTSVTIPNSVTIINDYAFCGCSRLTSVVIPNSVTSINYSAFYGCSRLTSVSFENTSGWWVYDRWLSSSSLISSSSLADASTAAKYLKSTYSDYHWRRR